MFQVSPNYKPRSEAYDAQNPATATSLALERASESSRQAVRSEPVAPQKPINPVLKTQKATGASLVAGGTAVQAAGVGARVAGTTANVAGMGISAVGAALSATGVGAVVGAPLAVTGRAVSVGGKATDKAGRMAYGTGKKIRRVGSSLRRNAQKKEAALERSLKDSPANSNPNNFRRPGLKQLAAISGIGGKLALKAKVTEVIIQLASPLIFLWTVLQLPFAILGILTLGLGSATQALNYTDGGVLGALAGAALALANAVGGIFGLNLTAAFVGLYFISLLTIQSIFIISVLVIWLRCALAGLNPVLGNGAGLKMGALLLCAIGYSLPIANMFPFIIFWLIAIWFYPR